MDDIINILTIILVVAWAVGFFAFQMGGLIHILLLLAVIVIAYRAIQGKRYS